jgi:hypothetical protein
MTSVGAGVRRDADPAAGGPGVRAVCGTPPRDRQLNAARRPQQAYVLRVVAFDATAPRIVLDAQKTMYGGKDVAPGDTVYVFVNETGGGARLVGRYTVMSAAPTPRRCGIARQTPRVDLTLRRTARATRALGRDEVNAFRAWDDRRPQTELNFKFFRQATPKLDGITDRCAEFVDALM